MAVVVAFASAFPEIESRPPRAATAVTYAPAAVTFGSDATSTERPSTFGSISTHEDVPIIPPPTAILDPWVPLTHSSCSRFARAANAMDSRAALARCPRPMPLKVTGTGNMNPPARRPTFSICIREAPKYARTPSDPAGTSCAAASMLSNGLGSPAHMTSASQRYELPASPHVLSILHRPSST